MVFFKWMLIFFEYPCEFRRGAILFFIIADLAMVDAMYQFSLSAFMQVFLKSLKKAMPNNSLPRRLENIKNSLTFLVFGYGCTGTLGNWLIDCPHYLMN